MIKLSEIKSNPNNPRIIRDDKFKKLVQSIKDFPKMMALRPIVVDKDGIVQGGNMRLKALIEAGYKEVPKEWIAKAENFTEDELREFIVKDNVSFGEWNWDDLANSFDNTELDEWGLDIPNFDLQVDGNEETFGTGEGGTEEAHRKLSDVFLIPPFSVFDTKQGYWQDRKRVWKELGIKSEETREDVMASLASANKVQGSEMPTVSIFDPVLCEICYQWFNLPKGVILDPFAGGSVRGIVAAKLGFEYVGIDLRQDQIDANRKNAYEVLTDSSTYPTWHCGNSLNIDTIAKGVQADFVFSCPPYHDLEQYSDNAEDLSNMSYEDFLTQYKEIIKKSVALLKNDRFACFVVGDIRDAKGFYKNFVSDTIMAFWNAGAILYNEIILVNTAGSLPIRAAKSFNGGRKVGKMHQNVLVFYKGNPKNIKNNFPELDFSEVTEKEELEAV